MIRAAASLQYRVALLKPTSTVDAVGAPVETFASEGTVWGDVRGAFAAERMSADERVARADAVIRLRSSALTRQINARWRVQVMGHTYDILSADSALDERARRTVELRAQRRADDFPVTTSGNSFTSTFDFNL